MDIFWFLLGGIFGYMLGRFHTPKDTTPEEQTCDFQRAQLEKDVAYYKKLTKTLADENTEFRRKQNDRTSN